ncbi:hypothetical protein AVEN_221243-1 [Araneus ventricosus]|uniref:Uncharacterized protein n=1 Tax=Araneus ventricosus TaxID=182803 RepID=A0A4Y2F3U8_ARAVE|nr:hypothetical protein AVEN_221243-1 [Araneus ventricosus]
MLASKLASGSKPGSTEDPSYIGHVAREIIRRRSNVFPLVRCGSLERAVPAQVSSSLSDLGSKWGAATENIPYAPSKRNVNITKLNSVSFSYTSYEFSAHVFIPIEHKAYFGTDLAILNLGQIKRTTPELAHPSPNFRVSTLDPFGLEVETLPLDHRGLERAFTLES